MFEVTTKLTTFIRHPFFFFPLFALTVPDTLLCLRVCVTLPLPGGLRVSEGLVRAGGGGEVGHAVGEVEGGEHVRGGGEDGEQFRLPLTVSAPAPGQQT